MKDISTYIPISKAKGKLLDIIHRLESVDDAVAVTKNGVPAASAYSAASGSLSRIVISADVSTTIIAAARAHRRASRRERGCRARAAGCIGR